MTVAAPVIKQEMDVWVSMGGGNSGIVGDSNHTYGYHCSANQVSSSDYSRSMDPNGSDGPYADWNYACAGDFSHYHDPGLRSYHANVLARLMAGELPMICEFIGQPFEGEAVYYWARWNGIDYLEYYTGSGHDSWSHISWYRSSADQPAGLWGEYTPVPPPVAETAPPFPWGEGHYIGQPDPDPFCHSGCYGGYDNESVRTWQNRMRQRGWSIGVDGCYGPQSESVARQFQHEKGIPSDGLVGPQTWDLTWSASIT